MAIGLGIASIAIGVIGSQQKASAMRRQAKEQRETDRLNQENYNLELGESIGRTERANRRTEGLARSQVGASGFGVGSSLDSYVESIQEQHSSEVDWMRTSGASMNEIMEREAEARRRSTLDRATGEMWSGVGNAFGSASGLKW